VGASLDASFCHGGASRKGEGEREREKEVLLPTFSHILGGERGEEDYSLAAGTGRSPLQKRGRERRHLYSFPSRSWVQERGGEGRWVFRKTAADFKRPLSPPEGERRGGREGLTFLVSVFSGDRAGEKRSRVVGAIIL